MNPASPPLSSSQPPEGERPDPLPERAPVSPRVQLRRAYAEGFEFAKRAKEEDQLGNIEPAKMFYIEAVSSFLSAIKMEPDEANRKLVAKEIVVYIDRAEQIKQWLNRYSNIQPSAPLLEDTTEPGMPIPTPQPSTSSPSKSLPDVSPLFSSPSVGPLPACVPGFTPSPVKAPSSPPSHHSSFSSASFEACGGKDLGPGQPFVLPSFPTPVQAPLPSSSQPDLPMPAFFLPNAPARDEHTRMCQQEMQNADFFLTRAVTCDEGGDRKAAKELYVQAGEYTLG